ncbi:MAG: 1-acyl-sn-glycerol-3-phosphate acyltransferase, partial [Bacteroidia bacterium]
MNLIWNLLAMLISLTCSIFYKKHKVKNKQILLEKRPAVIAFNHPNAFMDSVSFSIFAYPVKLYFLARGDVFRPGFVTWFFESLRIAPIFRIQDEGKEGLKKNDETYRRVNRLLKRNQNIVVYAEGLCVQERRLRPLKKGVPRMVFGAMEEINNPDFVVIPVGINYSDPKKFRSTVFFNVGKPMRVADYMEQYHEQPARAMNKFLHDLEPRMKDLIMHINDPKNDQLIAELEELLKKEWAKELGLNCNDL